MKPLPEWGYWVPILFLALVVSLRVGRGSEKFAVFSWLAILMGYMAIVVMAYRGSWFTDMAIATTGVLTGLIRYGYEILWRNRMTDLFGRYVPRAVVSETQS